MVPEGWSNVSLGDLVNYKKGFAFDSSDYSENGVRVIRISDTTRDGLHSNNPKYVAEDRADGFSDWQLFGGDIIVSTVGSRPHLLDSMVGKAVRIPSNFNGSLLNQNLVKLAPKKDRVISEVLYPHLKDNRFITFISGLVRGNANQVSITLKELFTFPILLPPLPEQRKIADILSTWDRAIETTEALLATARTQKRALMQSLLTGKRRFPEFEGQDWKEVRLGDVANIRKGEQKSKSTLGDGGEFPVINGGVTPSGYTDEWNTEADTITISEGGNSCGFVNRIFTRFWSGGHCYTLESPKVELDYLFHILKFGETDIMRLRVGSGLPNIQKKAISNYAFRMPKPLEQRAIAKILNNALTEEQNAETQIEKLRTEKKALMQQLLTGKRRVVANE